MHSLTFQPPFGSQMTTYCALTDVSYSGWSRYRSDALDNIRMLCLKGDGTPQTSAWYFAYQLTKLGIKVLSIEEIRPDWWKVTFGSNTFIPDK